MNSCPLSRDLVEDSIGGAAAAQWTKPHTQNQRVLQGLQSSRVPGVAAPSTQAPTADSETLRTVITQDQIIEAETQEEMEDDSDSDSDYDPDQDQFNSPRPPSVAELLKAESEIKAGIWEQFVTFKSIGGAHTGRIQLHLLFNNSTGKRYLIYGRSNKAYAGGQGYIPMSRIIIQKQSINTDPDIPTLPACLQHLMSPALGNMPGAKERKYAIYQKARRSICKLYDLFEGAQMDMKRYNSNTSVRFEFFSINSFQTLGHTYKGSDYCSCIYSSKPDDFLSQLGGIMEEVSKALYRTFVLNTSTLTKFEKLSPGVKGILMVCGELVVKLTEYCPYSGHITRNIARVNPHQEGRFQFFIHHDLLEPTDQAEMRLTGLAYKLRATAMEWKLEEEEEIKPPSDDDPHTRKLPPQIQMHQHCLNIGVAHPVFFLRQHLKICSLAQRAILDCLVRQGVYAEDSLPIVGIYEKPDFGALGCIGGRAMKKLVDDWCKIIRNAYQFEWFCIFRNQMLRQARTLNRAKRTRKEERVIPAFGTYAQFVNSHKEITDLKERCAESNSFLSLDLPKSYVKCQQSSIVRKHGKCTG